MQIELKINGKVFVLRGNDDATIDLCKWGEGKDKDGKTIPILLAFKYFSSLPSAVERILMMRVCTSDCETLQELRENLKEERKLLHKELGMYDENETPSRRRTK